MQVPMAKLEVLGTSHGPGYFDGDFSGGIIMIMESSRKQGWRAQAGRNYISWLSLMLPLLEIHKGSTVIDFLTT